MSKEFRYYFKPTKSRPPPYLKVTENTFLLPYSGILLKKDVILNHIDDTNILNKISLLDPLPWELISQIRFEYSIDPDSILELYSQYLIHIVATDFHF